MQANDIWSYGLCIYKKEEGLTKILLCKSVTSKIKWGLVKGGISGKESHEECAKREFFEEVGIDTKIKTYEKYFKQVNAGKSVGAWLVSYKNIPDAKNYFIDDKIPNYSLSWELSKARFFCLEELPELKDNQIKMLSEIRYYLQTNL